MSTVKKIVNIHKNGSAVTEAACESGGFTTHTCTACGDSYVTDEIAALGHNYETVTVAATCTTGGYTSTTCTNCGVAEVYDQTEALGHDYVSVTVDPTETEGGYTSHTCANCGDSYADTYTAALGHSYTSVEADGYLVYTCGTCGDSYSEKLASALTYNKVTSLTSDNNYVITLYSGNKYYALSHENTQISVVQITVSNGVVTSEITEDLVWTYSGNKLSYKDGNTTYYLYAQSASGWWGWFGTPTLTLSTGSSSSVSFSNSKLKVGSYYLRYSSKNASLNRSATTTYLFQETDET